MLRWCYACLRGLTRWVLRLTLALLVLGALFVVAGRVAMGHVGRFSDELAALLSAGGDLQVSVVDLHGYWRGLDPVFDLRGVTLAIAGDDATPAQAIVLDALEVRPDLLQSLLRWEPVIRELRLGSLVVDLGLLATLRRTESEVPDAANGEWLGNLARLAIPQLSFEEILVRLPEPHAGDVFWRVSGLTIRKNGYHFMGGGAIKNQLGDRTLADMRLDIGLEGGLSGIKGTVFLEWLDGAFLLPLNFLLQERGLRMEALRSSGRVWLTWQQGTLATVVAEAGLDDLLWRRNGEAQAPVQHFTVRLQGERQEQGRWRLDVDDLELGWMDRRMTGSRMGLITGPDGFELAWNRLDAGLLSGLLQSSGLAGDALGATLAAYAPRGFIDDARLSTGLPEGGVRLSARLTAFAVDAVDGAPAAQNVDGLLTLEGSHGRFDFSGPGVFLHFPELYASGWQFEHAEGQVRWVVHDDAVYVAGTAIKVTNPAGMTGRLRGDFSLWVPHEPGTANDFELSLGIADAAVVMAPSFVPDRLVNPAFTTWLAASARSGTIRHGGYHFAGLIGAAAPAGTHVSQMYFDIADARLDYHPDWPALEEFSALVQMRNGEMLATIPRGRLGSSRLGSPATLSLSERTGTALLTINASHLLRQEDLRYWLQNTPLREVTGGGFDGWEVSGTNRLNAEVVLALDGQVETRTDLRLQLARSALTVPALELSCRELSGSIDYRSRSGVSGGVRGDCLDEAVDLNLETLDWRTGRERLRLRVDGTFAAPRWLARLERPLPAGLLFGSAATRLELALPLRGGEHNLTISSALLGLGIDLPPPLAKRPDAETPLTVTASWTQAVGDSDWTVDWPGRLRARLRLQNGQFTQGVLGFGGLNSAEYVGEGLWIEGTLPVLDIERWAALARRWPREGGAGVGATGGNSTSAGTATTAGGSGVPDLSWFSGAMLELGLLDVGGQRFAHTRLGVVKHADFLQVLLDNGQQLSGEIELPRQGGVPVARFERLYLAGRSGDAPERGASTTGRPAEVRPAEVRPAEVRPADVPLAKVDISDLRIGDQRLGHWSWLAESRVNGVTFNDLVGRVPGGRFKARLSWIEDPQTGQQTSILTGSVEGTTFQDFYELWSATAAPLTSKTFGFDSAVVWTGGPTDFAWRNLNGQVGFNMDSGSFREVGGGADIFRVFGILNTDAITRRLQLDFSDLYEKGLAYDRIEGRARIQEGVVSFDTPLAIQAPSSAFKLTGSTSLVDDTLDMRMVVVLPVTQNLPLAALLIGAPQVGGALFLIDKLLGDSLSQLTSATYRIGGTLQTPQVSLEQIFTNNPPASAPRKER